MKNCKDCQHYVALGDGKNGNGETVQVGNCFRYPPEITVNGSSTYPTVGAAERQCGEFTLLTKRKASR